IPRLTFWDHQGTREWVEMTFREPRNLSRSSVYWFDDTGRGGCRVPASWKLLWRDGADWKSVEPRVEPEYPIARDKLSTVQFEPVTTRALRLEIELQKERSAGILEWQVGSER